MNDAPLPKPQPPRRKSELQIVSLLPNLLTIAAICAGLTAIRLGFQGDFSRAVALILVAAVLDGLDGRLARLLQSESRIGAELDSLADFLNFGVAPALMLYGWGLQDSGGLGWIAAMIYTVCCVIRLARFNVGSKSDDATPEADVFIGVPSPAGAMLVLLPLLLAKLWPDSPHLPIWMISVYMVLIGALMISRVPTYAFKKMTISRENVKFFLIAFVILVWALFTHIWATLVLFDLAYMGVIAWSWRHYRRSRKP